MRAAARARAEQRANWNQNFQVLLEGYRQAIALTQPMLVRKESS
jgi:hypothetical protein